MDRCPLPPSAQTAPTSSSVTRVAARQFPDVVVGHQPASKRLLVGGRKVIGTEDRLARPDVVFRMEMAVDAPLHLQGLLLPHERHAVDLAVAGRASHTFVYVDAVI